MTVELREIEYYAGKAYEVLLDGEMVGVVRHCFPSFERGPRQATYVTKRWRAKRPYWEYLRAESQRTSIDYPTRKQAVEQLLRHIASLALPEPPAE